MNVLESKSLVAQKIMGGALLLSVFLHIAGFTSLIEFGRYRSDKKYDVIKVTIKAPPPPAPTAPPAIPPKEIPKPEVKKEKVASERVNVKNDAPPVLGIDPSTVTKGGGISVPVGNTLMKDDDGTRLKPDQVGEFAGDLSQEAKLIPSTFTVPTYTETAIDAGLEGVFVVEAFIDDKGNVRDADLKKKIGYGMDERVLEACKKSKFTPKKNKFGKMIEGWTEVKIRLVIP